jgi:folate-binding protein YgfZ
MANSFEQNLIMTPEWITYLQQANAQIDNNTVIHFGQPEQERQQVLVGDIITDLSHFGLIKVTGSEAAQFLQGQLTNDVRQVTAMQSQLTACCNPKGRIIFNFRLLKRNDAYYLLLPHRSLETLVKRLRMYVLRADVQLEEVSDQLSRLGIAGTNSKQLLTDCLGFAPPTEINASLTENQITVITISDTRYLVFTETPQNLFQCATAQKVFPVGASAWQLLDILAGIPQIVSATTEEFVPQMVNYQAIGGVSFKKGCYTGQEIVARMQYLGKLKRRMYLAKIDTSALPEAGDKLYLSDNEQSVGQIVNAERHPDGGEVVLAVIQISQAESEDIHWQSQQGELLRLMDLPYSVSEK